MKSITITFFIFFSTAVIAVEVSLFEHAEITQDQWSQYHSAINNELSATHK